MSGGLPLQIEPLDLARNRVRLEGQYLTSELPRLAEYSPSKDAGVHVKLGFQLESESLIRVTGSISLKVRLRCERCLQPFELDVSLEPKFYFDVSGVEPDEMEERDIIQVRGPVDLKSLVEDEVLLALPMMPMHDAATCEVIDVNGPGQEQQATGVEKPFAQLADLLKGKDKD